MCFFTLITKMMNQGRMRGPLGRVMADVCDSQHHSFKGKRLGTRRKQHKGRVKKQMLPLVSYKYQGPVSRVLQAKVWETGLHSVRG